MNIFVVSTSPRVSARQLCDKHIVKMVLESTQILCSCYEPHMNPPYKPSHFNHPCPKWARSSRQNFNWLLTHALTLSEEYTKRYGKIHASAKVLEWILDNPPLHLPQIGLTKFVVCMPDACKRDKVTESYRQYYIQEKKDFAKWKLGDKPIWMV